MSIIRDMFENIRTLNNEEKRVYFQSICDEFGYNKIKDYISNMLKKIVCDECLKNNLDYKPLNLYFITTYEYYKNKFKNKKFKLDNGHVYNYENPIDQSGFINYYYKDIVVFLGHNVLNRIITVIFTAFHEVQHFQDYYNLNIDDLNSLDMWKLAFCMDQACTYDGSFYKSNHDQNMFEIRANLEGARKAKEFIKNNDIKGINYEKDIEYLDMLMDIYTYDMNTYNFYETFDRYIKVYRENKGKVGFTNFHSAFMNEDGIFNNLYALTRNFYIDKKEQGIRDCVSMILGSDAFFKEVISKENLKDDLSISEQKLLELYNYAFKMRESCARHIIDYSQQFFSKKKQFKYSDNERYFKWYREKRLKQFKEKYPNVEIVDPYKSRFRK